MLKKKQTKITADEHKQKQMALGKKLKNEHSATVREMEEKHFTILEAIQITNANLMLRLQSDSGNNGSNEYQTHKSQVEEIIAMYSGGTDIGSDLVKRIINVSAALKIPNGLDIEGGDNNSSEKEYIKKFIDVNQLNEGVCTELSKEAEKQGQCLVQLLWDESDNMVKIKYLSWNLYNYIVYSTGLNNMTAPYGVWWDDVEITSSEERAIPTRTIESGTLSDHEIAFVAFNKILNDDGTIEGSPSLGNVVSRLDDIGNDLIYWRKSNKLYAHPTPAVKIEEAEEAESIYNKITTSGWRLGQMLVSSGELKMVVPENFHETIKEAILMNVQLISGATGLAVSWMGFPDLMSNRAVADSLGEPLEIVAANDITSWKSFYEQMFDNVITIRNANLTSGSKALKTGIIKPKLKPMSDRIWQQLVRFYMISADNELISRESFWDKIPGFDVEKESRRMKEQEKKKIAEQKALEVEKTAISPNNRDDIGQENTGNRRFNNTQG